jgi:hypothetical protein
VPPPLHTLSLPSLQDDNLMVGAIKVPAQNHSYPEVTFAGTMVTETWHDQLYTRKHTGIQTHIPCLT